jgi:hypothetical protein
MRFGSVVGVDAALTSHGTPPPQQQFLSSVALAVEAFPQAETQQYSAQKRAPGKTGKVSGVRRVQRRLGWPPPWLGHGGMEGRTLLRVVWGRSGRE